MHTLNHSLIRPLTGAIALCFIIALSACALASARSNGDLPTLVNKYKSMMNQARTQNLDASSASELNMKSIEALKSGDKAKSEDYLRQAVAALESMGLDPTKGPPAPRQMVDMRSQSAALSSGAGPANMRTPLSIARSAAAESNAQYPFGIHEPFFIDGASQITQSMIVGYLMEAGVKWVRLIPPELETSLADLNMAGINVLCIVGGGPDSKSLADNDRITRATVLRYKDVVKYWQVGNEPDLSGMPVRDYRNLLKSTYAAVKGACPECMVVLGGTAFGNDELAVPDGKLKGMEYYSELLKMGGGTYFDIFDLHFAGRTDGYQKLTAAVGAYRKLLAEHGLYSRPIWITEMSTYAGAPEPIRHAGATIQLPPQSEAEQANGMVKLYVTGTGLGVRKMFWNLVVERYRFGGIENGYYDNVGLMTNPKRDGQAHKKLVYYTFRRMSAFFQGADMGSAEIAHYDGSTYAYRLMRSGMHVWVAWTEREGGAALRLPYPYAAGLVASEAVPRAASGRDMEGGGALYHKVVNLPGPDGAVHVNMERGKVYFIEPPAARGK